MASLASINVKFQVDLKQFSTDMQSALRSIDQFGQKMQSVGRTMTVGITAPIVAMGIASVSAIDKQEQAIAQLEAGLRSTGDVVGFTSKQLQGMAADLQKVSVYGDEDIMQGVTAPLLTFTKVSGPVFKEAQKSILDLSAKLGQDLQSSAIQVGKALNDPVKGITALKRVGVSFTEQQVDMIKQMTAANNVVGAQSIILKELNTEFGGSAEAAAKAGTGGFKQLQNQIGDLMEDFGKIVLEYLNPFFAKLKEMITYFQSLSPEMKKTIVVVAALAAAIGPLLFAFGAIASSLPAIAAGFMALTGPIGLTIAALAAVAYVVVDNWDVIKKYLVDIGNYFIDLYNSSTVFRTGIELVILAFKTLWTEAKLVFDGIKAAAEYVVSGIITSFSTLGKLVKAVLTFDLDGVKQALAQGFSSMNQNSDRFYKNTVSAGKKAFAELGKNASEAVSNALNGRNIKKLTIDKDKVDAKGVEDAVVQGVSNGAATASKRVKVKLEAVNVDLQTAPSQGTMSYYDAEIAKVQKFKNEVATTYDQVKMADDAIAKLEFGKALKFDPSSIIGGDLSDISKRMAAQAAGMNTAMNSVALTSQKMKETVAESAIPALASAFDNLGQGIVSSMGLAANGFGGFVAKLGATVTKLIAMMLSNAIALSIPGAVEAGTATGPLAPFTTPTFIAEAVGGVIAAFAAIPKFETGGIVGGSSYYGDKIMARVNSGEMILNSSQQQKLHGLMNNSIGAQSSVVIPQVKIKGQDLLLVFDRATNRKNRIG